MSMMDQLTILVVTGFSSTANFEILFSVAYVLAPLYLCGMKFPC